MNQDSVGTSVTNLNGWQHSPFRGRKEQRGAGGAEEDGFLLLKNVPRRNQWIESWGGGRGALAFLREEDGPPSGKRRVSGLCSHTVPAGGGVEGTGHRDRSSRAPFPPAARVLPSVIRRCQKVPCLPSSVSRQPVNLSRPGGPGKDSLRSRVKLVTATV